MRTVKLGLIGAGGIAQAHCGTLADIKGAEIIAASDLVPGKPGTGKRTVGHQTYVQRLQRNAQNGRN